MGGLRKLKKSYSQQVGCIIKLADSSHDSSILQLVGYWTTWSDPWTHFLMQDCYIILLFLYYFIFLFIEKIRKVQWS
jgi:hypothetical protein